MIRAVTFDLDDTLWDVRPALLRAESAQWDWLESRYPGKVSREEQARVAALRRTLLEQQPELAHHISRFRQQLLTHLLLDAGLPEAEAREAGQAAFETFLHERQRVDVFPTAASTLQALIERGYRLGALTNGNADVGKTSIGPLFDFVYRAEDVGASKPHPALFAAATRAADIKPHELVHVGDHLEHDVEGARNFGARSVWFNPTGETHPLADACVSCLSELPGVIGQL
jgi:putative hydrolase of the HAD superfamily